MPGIIKKGVEPVRVWSAGCACGEEVYSIKILWALLERQFDTLPVLDILATDMNPVYLDRAKVGIYTKSSLKEVSEERRANFFQPNKRNKCFAVKPSLKEGICWARRHLLHDAAEKRFHIIFLRNNLLTYYGEELKEPAFRKVVDHLEPEGYLIIGAHEKIPNASSGLVPDKEHPSIFQR
jgi:chemotaxis protein methyltransferase CheR